jgi:hypothetical protein
MARKFYIENEVANGEPSIKFELTKPSGFTEITDTDRIKELYLIQYKYRIKDGKEYVLGFTSDRYIDIIKGVYTDEEIFALENHIKELQEQLNNGCWLTAQNTNSNLETSGIYTKSMKDEIQATIDSYVADNY